MGFGSGSERRNLLVRIETITRQGKEFAMIPMQELQKLIEDAEMLADVKAYDAPKTRLQDGEDELARWRSRAETGRGRPAADLAGIPEAYSGTTGEEVEAIPGADRGN